MPLLLHLQAIKGKGDGGGKKCFCIVSWLLQDHECGNFVSFLFAAKNAIEVGIVNFAY